LQEDQVEEEARKLRKAGEKEVRKESEEEECEEKVRIDDFTLTCTKLVAGLVGISATRRNGPGRTSTHAPGSRVALGTMTAMALLAGGAHAQGAATWRFAPAQPPPPPPGVTPAPYPVQLGPVGDLSFWAPNRGLLITGGAGPVAPGLYAYDGVSWHQLATVCGGSRGRIAWAGPDDFWTISDQRPGQLLPPGTGFHELQSLSLCHFLNGQVVGSYAMPLQEPGSYLPMDAAACYGPDDCWFGGQDGQDPGRGPGAFHLHWNGSEVVAVYGPEDHAVTDMVNFAGELYESVQIGAGDAFLPSESQKHPAVIHTIAPAGQAALCNETESAFCEVFAFSEASPPGRILPEYGREVSPVALQGFSLGTDGSPLGAGATQLWAAAGPVPNQWLPPGLKPGSVTVLHYAAGAWSQILPAEGVSAPGGLSGAESMQAGGVAEGGTSEAIAPEPGTDKAWLSLGGEVALLNLDGTLEQQQSLPVEAQEPEPVGNRGGTGPIVCPAPHDCWMATSELGWLFHLSDGSSPPANGDPFFDGGDGVISYRPPDSGVPTIYPDAPPQDDSLANQQPAPAPVEPPSPPLSPSVRRVKGRPLLTSVHSRLLEHSRLVVSFTLTGRAHVQLVGRRKKRIVARTRPRALKAGRHKLSLRLDPARWPTKVQFEATPIGGSAPAGGVGESGTGDTIGT
jgi:hypothetical protein